MSINRSTNALIGLKRGHKKIIVLINDVILCLLATWIAFSLRFDELATLTSPLVIAASASIAIATPIFIVSGLYRAIFRFSGWFAGISLIRAVVIYTVLYAGFFLVFGFEGIPRSIGIIQPVFLFIGIGISRLVAKQLLDNWMQKSAGVVSKGGVLIYGAGSAGRQIASGLRQGFEMRLIGFVDDDRRLWNSTIAGLPVLSPNQMISLIQRGGVVTDVFLTIPSASRLRQREILSTLSNLPIRVRSLPGLSHLAHGKVMVEDIREVQIEDVLGREQVPPNQELLHQNITNKVVLVTGAGGSIGSELCKQILVQNPSALILYELNEFSLYSIERELALLKTGVMVIPALGSVLDNEKFERLLQRFNVQTVFHAAAYKHVSMLEMNPSVGVWNNVFGTLRTVDSCCHCGVETFVLISTDKAVRPTSIMGCSKRVSELVLQAKSISQKNLDDSGTKLTMVRFGNVLGSSGSVVPAFRDQIKKGGPVLVTHPNIIRYFMTISEAAQLVIQAGAMGEGGDVMILDMGEPVRIVDLAKRMIHLSGLSQKDESNPGGDIEIKFSSMHPGEKLYEELLIGSNTLPTSHPRIMRATETCLSWINLEPLLFELEVAINNEDSNLIRKILKKIIPEFNPPTENCDILLG